MKHLLRLGTLACAAILTGCTGALVGEPTKATDSHVLPDEADLSDVLGSPMKVSDAPQVGGLDVLPDNIGDASPLDCVGVKRPRMRQTYQDAPVRSARTILWQTNPDVTTYPRPNFAVTVGVVELESTRDARAWYSKFSAQWQLCQGKTVITHNVVSQGTTYSDKITRVSDSGGIVTAVDMQMAMTGDARPSPMERALTAESRYLVDVQVADIGWRTNDSINANNAIAVAQLIADTINSTP
ncbi:sensor domain-containing protein [Mycolicibacterium septicum DSM 44393]|uniref:Sensor domain-containing protein n=1 Tax=Mycolicibacterium septicum DSM 44393 TaxID=1341646 RepID=A0A7X6MWL7_9MYCO|nr:sensor domain-containing protein [Mycolicibacterium septicum]NKZ14294.1 sensor domain-containing protein [Mycolicibacterium septicum DSM 44393]